MARFYDGQPVVCTWERERWDYWHVEHLTPPIIPIKGQRYTVAHYHPESNVHVRLVECPSHAAYAYNEDGFAPITDEQVRGIIEEATRVPSREREDA